MVKKKHCLNCKFFRLRNAETGLCRVDKSLDPYPEREIAYCCERWQDCGQQYYIRLGWLKAQTNENRQ
jgi:hypothetical protein